MIKLSNLADYAVLLLALLAQEKRIWAASELSERTGVPMPTTSKLLKMLTKAEILEAQRGATGGYKLMMLPSALSVARIIEAVDGPIALTSCVHTDAPVCIAQSTCITGKGWRKLNVAVRDALDTVKLADLAGT